MILALIYIELYEAKTLLQHFLHTRRNITETQKVHHGTGGELLKRSVSFMSMDPTDAIYVLLTRYTSEVKSEMLS